MEDQDDCSVRSALAGIFDFSRLSAISQADQTSAFKCHGTLWSIGRSGPLPGVLQFDTMERSELAGFFYFSRPSSMGSADLTPVFLSPGTYSRAVASRGTPVARQMLW